MEKETLKFLLIFAMKDVEFVQVQMNIDVENGIMD